MSVSNDLSSVTSGYPVYLFSHLFSFFFLVRVRFVVLVVLVFRFLVFSVLCMSVSNDLSSVIVGFPFFVVAGFVFSLWLFCFLVFLFSVCLFLMASHL